MVTSLGQLLDSVTDEAQAAPRTAATRADAATAIGQLGRALTRLRHDGVSPAIGDHRERQIASLAMACTELGSRAPATESTLSILAAAAADTLAVLHDHMTVGARWAAATAVAETVTPLVYVIGGDLPAGPAAQWLHQVERQSVLVQQTAALQPPSRAGSAILDRPLAGHAPTSADPASVVPFAVAAMLRATGRVDEVPSVAEVLAFTLAAETLSGAVQRLDTSATTSEGGAASGWRAVRQSLRPYDDGTRRPQPHAPPGVDAALRLHRALDTPGSRAAQPDEPLRGVVVAAAQHLPTLASQLLYRTVRHWADDGALLAYARDVPPREERVAAYLRGYQTGGLVRVNAVDLEPVAGALHNARLLSLDIATRVAAQREGLDADFPRRSLAANQAALQRPEAMAALDAARHEAGRQAVLRGDGHDGPRRARW